MASQIAPSQVMSDKSSGSANTSNRTLEADFKIKKTTTVEEINEIKNIEKTAEEFNTDEGKDNKKIRERDSKAMTKFATAVRKNLNWPNKKKKAPVERSEDYDSHQRKYDAKTTEITLKSSPSQVKSAKSSESFNTSKDTLKVTDFKKSQTKNDAKSDSDQIKNTTSVQTEETLQKNCTYVLGTTDSKKFANHCCCQFLKSLPPTPRETFRKNPGNPHFYPAPGHRRAWTYELKLRQMESLEQERQRLCSEKRGIPYNGPPKQYQDFFDETPVEARCCCSESCEPKKIEGECSKKFKSLVASVKRYVNKINILKENNEKELVDLKKKCAEDFLDINPPIETKSKSTQCRGGILNENEFKEKQVKQIAERMAAICSCLNDCDCKAALQAKDPDAKLDEIREVCCCSRKETGRVDETFDCNAGDPHRQPTIAAFRHTFEFKKEKQSRIAKRKSIYDEIVQYGTETEIEEARMSLLQQMLEDGTKEEKEEARKSLQLEEAESEEEEEKDYGNVCDCPEFQEIVIMMEDSDSDEEPFYKSYSCQTIHGCDRESLSETESIVIHMKKSIAKIDIIQDLE